jgi:hypothetical protein
VRPGTSTRVLLIPPGQASLSCSYETGTRQTTAAQVTLQDPGHHFRLTTLGDLNCQISATPAWKFGDGRGPTPDAAVRALLAEFPEAPQLEPRRVPVGYVDAARDHVPD